MNEQVACFSASERDPLATATITHPCRGSSATVTTRKLKSADLVELVSLIFYQLREELFNSLMARYAEWLNWKF